MTLREWLIAGLLVELLIFAYAMHREACHVTRCCLMPESRSGKCGPLY